MSNLGLRVQLGLHHGRKHNNLEATNDTTRVGRKHQTSHSGGPVSGSNRPRANKGPTYLLGVQRAFIRLHLLHPPVPARTFVFSLLCICAIALTACNGTGSNKVENPTPAPAPAATPSGPPLSEVLPNNALVALAIGKDGEGWAVGQGEVILHLQEGRWSVQRPPVGSFGGSNRYLKLVATASYASTTTTVTAGEARAWAYSNHNALLQLEGNEWAGVTNPSDAVLSDIAVTPDGDAWAVGVTYSGPMSSNQEGTSMRYQASTGQWSVVELPGPTNGGMDSVVPHDLAMAPDGSVWAVAPYVLLRVGRGESKWEFLTLPSESRPSDIAFSEDGTAWLLGDKTMWRYKPREQSASQGSPGNGANDGPTTIQWEEFAGENIENMLRDWHGTSMAVSPSGKVALILASARTQPGSPQKQAFLLLDFEVGRMTQMSSPTDLLIHDVVWSTVDDAWAVGGSKQQGGGQGIILHYSGGEWSIYDPENEQ